jgi:hypothetical protein
MPDTIVLGEGIIESDYPPSLQPQDFTFAVVAINPSIAHDRYELEFPADLVDVEGDLVAVVTRQPRRKGGARYQPGFVDTRARQGAPVPAEGTEVVLGSGPVRLRRRIAGARPTKGPRTAIRVGDALDAEQVRQVIGMWVTLELRPPGAA